MDEVNQEKRKRSVFDLSVITFNERWIDVKDNEKTTKVLEGFGGLSISSTYSIPEQAAATMLDQVRRIQQEKARVSIEQVFIEMLVDYLTKHGTMDNEGVINVKLPLDLPQDILVTGNTPPKGG